MNEQDLETLRCKVDDYIKWDPVESTRKEIEQLKLENNWDELRNRINNRLTFGTAGNAFLKSSRVGLRGRMGAGYNCMNDLVVLQTAQVGFLHFPQK